MLLHSTFRLRNYQRIDQCIENLLKRTHIYTHRSLSLYLRALPNILKHTKTDNRFQNIALEENCPLIPKLTLIKTLTVTRGQFPSGAIVWLPPNPKTNSNLDRNPNPNGRGGGERGQFSPGEQLSGYCFSITFSSIKIIFNFSKVFTFCSLFIPLVKYYLSRWLKSFPSLPFLTYPSLQIMPHVKQGLVPFMH